MPARLSTSSNIALLDAQPFTSTGSTWSYDASEVGRAISTPHFKVQALKVHPTTLIPSQPLPSSHGRSEVTRVPHQQNLQRWQQSPAIFVPRAFVVAGTANECTLSRPTCEFMVVTCGCSSRATRPHHISSPKPDSIYQLAKHRHRPAALLGPNPGLPNHNGPMPAAAARRRWPRQWRRCCNGYPSRCQRPSRLLTATTPRLPGRRGGGCSRMRVGICLW